MKSKISVIIPVYNEGKNIQFLYDELKMMLDSLGKDHEIIIVDDGSVDESPGILKALAAKDNSLKAITFSKNFGQTASLMSGIDSASGDIIVLMDGDLQNDPQDIPSLISKIEEGYEQASGWRKNRRDNFLTRTLPSMIANKIISFLSGVHLHDYGCTLKAYRANMLKSIKLYGEMHRFIPIHASWLGAKIIEVKVNHRKRKHGRSKYTLYRALKVILDMITIVFIANYRTKPIYVFGGSGICLIILSFLCVFVLIYNKFAHGVSMIQSPFLILSSIFIDLGVQSILMGLLAEMQMRTHYESLNKPIYYIKEKINV